MYVLSVLLLVATALPASAWSGPIKGPASILSENVNAALQIDGGDWVTSAVTTEGTTSKPQAYLARWRAGSAHAKWELRTTPNARMGVNFLVSSAGYLLANEMRDHPNAAPSFRLVRVQAADGVEVGPQLDVTPSAAYDPSIVGNDKLSYLDPIVAGVQRWGEHAIVAGNFSAIGSREVQHLASVNLRTGEVSDLGITELVYDGNFVNGTGEPEAPVVTGVSVHGDTAWVTGRFDQVNGRTRHGLFAIDLNTKQLVDNVASNAFDGTVLVGSSYIVVAASMETLTLPSAANLMIIPKSGGSPRWYALDDSISMVLRHGDTAILSGMFTRIGKVRAPGLARISLSSGQIMPYTRTGTHFAENIPEVVGSAGNQLVMRSAPVSDRCNPFGPKLDNTEATLSLIAPQVRCTGARRISLSYPQYRVDLGLGQAMDGPIGGRYHVWKAFVAGFTWDLTVVVDGIPRSATVVFKRRQGSRWVRKDPIATNNYGETGRWFVEEKTLAKYYCGFLRKGEGSCRTTQSKIRASCARARRTFWKTMSGGAQAQVTVKGIGTRLFTIKPDNPLRCTVDNKMRITFDWDYELSWAWSK